MEDRETSWWFTPGVAPHFVDLGGNLVACKSYLFQTAALLKDSAAACDLPAWYDPERVKWLKPVTGNAVASAAYRSWVLNRKTLLAGVSIGNPSDPGG